MVRDTVKEELAWLAFDHALDTLCDNTTSSAESKYKLKSEILSVLCGYRGFDHTAYFTAHLFLNSTGQDFKFKVKKLWDRYQSFIKPETKNPVEKNYGDFDTLFNDVMRSTTSSTSYGPAGIIWN